MCAKAACRKNVYHSLIVHTTWGCLLFYKVQSTTLSSQTLDVVGVERIHFLGGPQKLAPGLC